MVWLLKEWNWNFLYEFVFIFNFLNSTENHRRIKVGRYINFIGKKEEEGGKRTETREKREKEWRVRGGRRDKREERAERREKRGDRREKRGASWKIRTDLEQTIHSKLSRDLDTQWWRCTSSPTHATGGLKLILRAANGQHQQNPSTDNKNQKMLNLHSKSQWHTQLVIFCSLRWTLYRDIAECWLITDKWTAAQDDRDWLKERQQSGKTFRAWVRWTANSSAEEISITIENRKKSLPRPLRKHTGHRAHKMTVRTQCHTWRQQYEANGAQTASAEEIPLTIEIL